MRSSHLLLIDLFMGVGIGVTVFVAMAAIIACGTWFSPEPSAGDVALRDRVITQQAALINRQVEVIDSLTRRDSLCYGWRRE